jgi:hypothetical protein
MQVGYEQRAYVERLPEPGGRVQLATAIVGRIGERDSVIPFGWVPLWAGNSRLIKMFGV